MEYSKNIFDPKLFASGRKYGTEHVLVNLIDSWKYFLDNDNFGGTVLMDLPKCMYS